MRILLVDGYPDTAATLQELLELHGHEVAVAENGSAGFEAALRFNPEIVVCDLVLPGLDGATLCQKLRASTTPPLRFVCWTGLLTPELRDRAVAAGFEAVIPKPETRHLLGYLMFNRLPMPDLSEWRGLDAGS